MDRPWRARFQETYWEGGYGVVDEYKWKGRRVTVKTLAFEGREILEHEAALLKRVQGHPNIVELIGCSFNERQDKGMLVMELLSGDLRSLIDKCRGDQPQAGAAPFPLEVSLDMMRQIAAGLEHLRQLRVLHRDLKSMNILVKPVIKLGLTPCEAAGYVLKLSDFGRAKCNMKNSRFRSVVAPPRWRAPEVSRDKDMVGKAYTWSSDVYSFAMVCYEILSGDTPFHDSGMSAAALREAIRQGRRPALPANCPEELLQLIEECWATNPDERPAMADVHRRLLAIEVKGDMMGGPKEEGGWSLSDYRARAYRARAHATRHENMCIARMGGAVIIFILVSVVSFFIPILGSWRCSWVKLIDLQ